MCTTVGIKVQPVGKPGFAPRAKPLFLGRIAKRQVIGFGPVQAIAPSAIRPISPIKTVTTRSGMSTSRVLFIAELLKVGTASDIRQRLTNLKQQSYGGIQDWEMLFYAKVKFGGRVEQKALATLNRYSVSLNYNKDGRDQEATELIKSKFSTILNALVDAIGQEAVRDKFLSRRHSQFEFD